MSESRAILPHEPTLYTRDGRVFTNSMHVAEFFGKLHNTVLRDIRMLVLSDEFREYNYVQTLVCKGSGAVERSTPVIEMTRDGFMFLCMGYRGEKAGLIKERYIAAFNRMEEELRRLMANPAPAPDLTDAATLRSVLLGYTERVLALEEKVEEMTPQVQALSRISESGGSLCITDAAKDLKLRPKLLFDFLRSRRWIYRRTGSNSDIAYQDKIESGLLEHKTTTITRSDGSEKTVSQVRVTPKGLARLGQEFPPLLQLVG
ncbi:phage regulatory protein, rha family [Fulvimarina manganoxydans]|uniref:Phage regulatory protein, rha family n=1 Tax=Fulvimarina manganoxydans TaxID=937218 RepID=A0A1W2A8W9_9HYPH|nr:phage regulatory protein/antirepressor Ant [Fulvimarina manganoxydans]SMC56871.1 phage regulatory protein, rha family [Fulvimarina manganoxydans]